MVLLIVAELAVALQARIAPSSVKGASSDVVEFECAPIVFTTEGAAGIIGAKAIKGGLAPGKAAFP